MSEDSAGALDIRRGGKSAAAFRTISEVAEELAVPQHVLRFWESKFVQLKPLKRGGGRRYYRPEDVTLLRHIKSLLYHDGYTIKGVQKLLRENNGKTEKGPTGAVGGHGTSESPTTESDVAAGGGALSLRLRDEIEAAVLELETLRDLLKRRH